VKPFDLSFFTKQGFCIVDDVFTHHRCDDLIAASHEFPSYEDKSITPVMDPHRFQAWFFLVIRCSEIIKGLKNLFSASDIKFLGEIQYGE